jgi:hypothetical protein
MREHGVGLGRNSYAGELLRGPGELADLNAADKSIVPASSVLQMTPNVSGPS